MQVGCNACRALLPQKCAAPCLDCVSCADGFIRGAGNEAVLRARFEDAQFFYAADLKQPLEAFLPKLAGTQFHKDLGNLLQKSERVTALIRPLAELTGLTGASYWACCQPALPAWK